MVFVNGVNTDADQFTDDMESLAQLACSAAITPDSIVGFWVGSDGLRADLWNARDLDDDIDTAGADSVAVAMSGDVSRSHAALLSRIERSIKDGYRIIVVSHSRGNVQSERALLGLTARYSATVLEGCVRSINIAPPPINHVPSFAKPRGLIVMRDILFPLWLAQGGYPEWLFIKATADTVGPVATHAFTHYLFDPYVAPTLSEWMLLAVAELESSACSPADEVPSGEVGTEARSAHDGGSQFDGDSLRDMSASDLRRLAALRGAWFDNGDPARGLAIRFLPGLNARIAYDDPSISLENLNIALYKGIGTDTLYVVGQLYDTQGKRVLPFVVARGLLSAVEPGGMLIRWALPEVDLQCAIPALKDRRWKPESEHLMTRVSAATALRIDEAHRKQRTSPLAVLQAFAQAAVAENQSIYHPSDRVCPL